MTFTFGKGIRNGYITRLRKVALSQLQVPPYYLFVEALGIGLHQKIAQRIIVSEFPLSTYAALMWIYGATLLR